MPKKAYLNYDSSEPVNQLFSNIENMGHSGFQQIKTLTLSPKREYKIPKNCIGVHDLMFYPETNQRQW